MVRAGRRQTRKATAMPADTAVADFTVAAPPVAPAFTGGRASGAPQAHRSFDLDLDVFDGPFDLLITLILKDEIDIWEVRVSRIIAEYVLKLADSGEFDLDATSQFVVLVAALLEMKSRLLLEEDVEEELEDLDPDEAAERLLERLVRYSQFKNVAGALRQRWDEHSARLYRSIPVPPALLRRPAPAGTLPAPSLPAALAPLLREPPVPDTSHLADLAVSLVKELRRLRLILGDEGGFTFAAVAPEDRLERAVTFFALLELHSGGEAVLRQRRHLGDIVVTRVKRPAQALAAAV
jgi:segregation and condensation protein A